MVWTVPRAAVGLTGWVLLGWVLSGQLWAVTILKTPSGRANGARAGATATQGYLGVDVRDVGADRVAALKLKSAGGAEIIHVDHDGPAGKAGLRVHDVVLVMNGQAVTGEEQFRRMLRETPAGHAVALLLSRDGQQTTVTTELGDREAVDRAAWEQHMTLPDAAPAAPPPSPQGEGFMSGGAGGAANSGDAAGHSLIGSLMLGSSYTGATLEMIGQQLAAFFGIEGGRGLLVRSVDAASPAAAAGLRAGDVVVRADAQPIRSTGQWSKLVKQSRGRELTVVVVRERQEQTLRLVPDGKRRSAVEPLPLPGSAARPVLVGARAGRAVDLMMWEMA